MSSYDPSGSVHRNSRNNYPTSPNHPHHQQQQQQQQQHYGHRVSNPPSQSQYQQGMLPSPPHNNNNGGHPLPSIHHSSSKHSSNQQNMVVTTTHSLTNHTSSSHGHRKSSTRSSTHSVGPHSVHSGGPSQYSHGPPSNHSSGSSHHNQMVPSGPQPVLTHLSSQHESFPEVLRILVLRIIHNINQYVLMQNKTKSIAQIPPSYITAIQRDMKILIDHGGNLNNQYKFKNYILHYAMQQHAVMPVLLALYYGARVNLPHYITFSTPINYLFHVANSHYYKDNAVYLLYIALMSGANPNYCSPQHPHSPLTVLLSMRQTPITIQMIKLLLAFDAIPCFMYSRHEHNRNAIQLDTTTNPLISPIAATPDLITKPPTNVNPPATLNLDERTVFPNETVEKDKTRGVVPIIMEPGPIYKLNPFTVLLSNYSFPHRSTAIESVQQYAKEAPVDEVDAAAALGKRGDNDNTNNNNDNNNNGNPDNNTNTALSPLQHPNSPNAQLPLAPPPQVHDSNSNQRNNNNNTVNNNLPSHLRKPSVTTKSDKVSSRVQQTHQAHSNDHVQTHRMDIQAWHYQQQYHLHVDKVITIFDMLWIKTRDLPYWSQFDQIGQITPEIAEEINSNETFLHHHIDVLRVSPIYKMFAPDSQRLPHIRLIKHIQEHIPLVYPYPNVKRPKPSSAVVAALSTSTRNTAAAAGPQIDKPPPSTNKYQPRWKLQQRAIGSGFLNMERIWREKEILLEKRALQEANSHGSLGKPPSSSRRRHRDDDDDNDDKGGEVDLFEKNRYQYFDLCDNSDSMVRLPDGSLKFTPPPNPDGFRHTLIQQINLFYGFQFQNSMNQISAQNNASSNSPNGASSNYNNNSNHPNTTGNSNNNNTTSSNFLSNHNNTNTNASTPQQFSALHSTNSRNNSLHNLRRPSVSTLQQPTLSIPTTFAFTLPASLLDPQLTTSTTPLPLLLLIPQIDIVSPDAQRNTMRAPNLPVIGEIDTSVTKSKSSSSSGSTKDHPSDNGNAIAVNDSKTNKFRLRDIFKRFRSTPGQSGNNSSQSRTNTHTPNHDLAGIPESDEATRTSSQDHSVSPQDRTRTIPSNSNHNSDFDRSDSNLSSALKSTKTTSKDKLMREQQLRQRQQQRSQWSQSQQKTAFQQATTLIELILSHPMQFDENTYFLLEALLGDEQIQSLFCRANLNTLPPYIIAQESGDKKAMDILIEEYTAEYYYENRSKHEYLQSLVSQPFFYFMSFMFQQRHLLLNYYLSRQGSEVRRFSRSFHNTYNVEHRIHKSFGARQCDYMFIYIFELFLQLSIPLSKDWDQHYNQCYLTPTQVDNFNQKLTLAKQSPTIQNVNELATMYTSQPAPRSLLRKVYTPQQTHALELHSIVSSSITYQQRQALLRLRASRTLFIMLDRGYTVHFHFAKYLLYHYHITVNCDPVLSKQALSLYLNDVSRNHVFASWNELPGQVMSIHGIPLPDPNYSTNNSFFPPQFALEAPLRNEQLPPSLTATSPQGKIQRAIPETPPLQPRSSGNLADLHTLHADNDKFGRGGGNDFASQQQQSRNRLAGLSALALPSLSKSSSRDDSKNGSNLVTTPEQLNQSNSVLSKPTPNLTFALVPEVNNPTTTLPTAGCNPQGIKLLYEVRDLRFGLDMERFFEVAEVPNPYPLNRYQWSTVSRLINNPEPNNFTEEQQQALNELSKTPQSGSSNDDSGPEISISRNGAASLWFQPAGTYSPSNVAGLNNNTNDANGERPDLIRTQSDLADSTLQPLEPPEELDYLSAYLILSIAPPQTAKVITTQHGVITFVPDIEIDNQTDGKSITRSVTRSFSYSFHPEAGSYRSIEANPQNFVHNDKSAQFRHLSPQHYPGSAPRIGGNIKGGMLMSPQIEHTSMMMSPTSYKGHFDPVSRNNNYHSITHTTQQWQHRLIKHEMAAEEYGFKAMEDYYLALQTAHVVDEQTLGTAPPAPFTEKEIFEKKLAQEEKERERDSREHQRVSRKEIDSVYNHYLGVIPARDRDRPSVYNAQPHSSMIELPPKDAFHEAPNFQPSHFRENIQLLLLLGVDPADPQYLRRRADMLYSDMAQMELFQQHKRIQTQFTQMLSSQDLTPLQDLQLPDFTHYSPATINSTSTYDLDAFVLRIREKVHAQEQVKLQSRETNNSTWISHDHSLLNSDNWLSHTIWRICQWIYTAISPQNGGTAQQTSHIRTFQFYYHFFLYLNQRRFEYQPLSDEDLPPFDDLLTRIKKSNLFDEKMLQLFDHHVTNITRQFSLPPVYSKRTIPLGDVWFRPDLSIASSSKRDKTRERHSERLEDEKYVDEVDGPSKHSSSGSSDRGAPGLFQTMFSGLIYSKYDHFSTTTPAQPLSFLQVLMSQEFTDYTFYKGFLTFVLASSQSNTLDFITSNPTMVSLSFENLFRDYEQQHLALITQKPTSPHDNNHLIGSNNNKNYDKNNNGRRSTSSTPLSLNPLPSQQDLSHYSPPIRSFDIDDFFTTPNLTCFQITKTPPRDHTTRLLDPLNPLYNSKTILTEDVDIIYPGHFLNDPAQTWLQDDVPLGMAKPHAILASLLKESHCHLNVMSTPFLHFFSITLPRYLTAVVNTIKAKITVLHQQSVQQAATRSKQLYKYTSAHYERQGAFDEDLYRHTKLYSDIENWNMFLRLFKQTKRTFLAEISLFFDLKLKNAQNSDVYAHMIGMVTRFSYPILKWLDSFPGRMASRYTDLYARKQELLEHFGQNRRTEMLRSTLNNLPLFVIPSDMFLSQIILREPLRYTTLLTRQVLLVLSAIVSIENGIAFTPLQNVYTPRPSKSSSSSNASNNHSASSYGNHSSSSSSGRDRGNNRDNDNNDRYNMSAGTSLHKDLRGACEVTLVNLDDDGTGEHLPPQPLVNSLECILGTEVFSPAMGMGYHHLEPQMPTNTSDLGNIQEILMIAMSKLLDEVPNELVHNDCVLVQELIDLLLNNQIRSYKTLKNHISFLQTGDSGRFTPTQRLNTILTQSLLHSSVSSSQPLLQLSQTRRMLTDEIMVMYLYFTFSILTRSMPLHHFRDELIRVFTNAQIKNSPHNIIFTHQTQQYEHLPYHPFTSLGYTSPMLTFPVGLPVPVDMPEGFSAADPAHRYYQPHTASQTYAEVEPNLRSPRDERDQQNMYRAAVEIEKRKRFQYVQQQYAEQHFHLPRDRDELPDARYPRNSQYFTPPEHTFSKYQANLIQMNIFGNMHYLGPTIQKSLVDYNDHVRLFWGSLSQWRELTTQLSNLNYHLQHEAAQDAAIKAQQQRLAEEGSTSARIVLFMLEQALQLKYTMLLSLRYFISNQHPSSSHLSHKQNIAPIPTNPQTSAIMGTIFHGEYSNFFSNNSWYDMIIDTMLIRIAQFDLIDDCLNHPEYFLIQQRQYDAYRLTIRANSDKRFARDKTLPVSTTSGPHDDLRLLPPSQYKRDTIDDPADYLKPYSDTCLNPNVIFEPHTRNNLHQRINNVPQPRQSPLYSPSRATEDADGKLSAVQNPTLYATEHLAAVPSSIYYGRRKFRYHYQLSSQQYQHQASLLSAQRKPNLKEQYIPPQQFVFPRDGSTSQSKQTIALPSELLDSVPRHFSAPQISSLLSSLYQSEPPVAGRIVALLDHIVSIEQNILSAFISKTTIITEGTLVTFHKLAAFGFPFEQVTSPRCVFHNQYAFPMPPARMTLNSVNVVTSSSSPNNHYQQHYSNHMSQHNNNQSTSHDHHQTTIAEYYANAVIPAKSELSPKAIVAWGQQQQPLVPVSNGLYRLYLEHRYKYFSVKNETIPYDLEETYAKLAQSAREEQILLYNPFFALLAAGQHDRINRAYYKLIRFMIADMKVSTVATPRLHPFELFTKNVRWFTVDAMATLFFFFGLQHPIPVFSSTSAPEMYLTKFASLFTQDRLTQLTNFPTRFSCSSFQERWAYTDLPIMSQNNTRDGMVLDENNNVTTLTSREHRKIRDTEKKRQEGLMRCSKRVYELLFSQLHYFPNNRQFLSVVHALACHPQQCLRDMIFGYFPALGLGQDVIPINQFTVDKPAFLLGSNVLWRTSRTTLESEPICPADCFVVPTIHSCSMSLRSLLLHPRRLAFFKALSFPFTFPELTEQLPPGVLFALDDKTNPSFPRPLVNTPTIYDNRSMIYFTQPSAHYLDHVPNPFFQPATNSLSYYNNYYFSPPSFNSNLHNISPQLSSFSFHLTQVHNQSTNHIPQSQQPVHESEAPDNIGALWYIIDNCLPSPADLEILLFGLHGVWTSTDRMDVNVQILKANHNNATIAHPPIPTSSNFNNPVHTQKPQFGQVADTSANIELSRSVCFFPALNPNVVNKHGRHVIFHALVRRWPEMQLKILINAIGFDAVLSVHDTNGKTILDYLLIFGIIEYANDVYTVLRAWSDYRLCSQPPRPLPHLDPALVDPSVVQNSSQALLRITNGPRVPTDTSQPRQLDRAIFEHFRIAAALNRGLDPSINEVLSVHSHTSVADSDQIFPGVRYNSVLYDNQNHDRTLKRDASADHVFQVMTNYQSIVSFLQLHLTDFERPCFKMPDLAPESRFKLQF